MLLIVNNKSRFIRKLEHTLDEWKVRHMLIPYDAKIDLGTIQGIKGIILSGGNVSLRSKRITNNLLALRDFKVPIIGFCMGHEIIAVHYGGKVAKLPKKQECTQVIAIDQKDRLLKGLPKRIWLKEKHTHHVSRLPKGFVALAHSNICPIEIMRHRTKKIYGFQSHPEASGKHGKTIMQNFVKMCREKTPLFLST